MKRLYLLLIILVALISVSVFDRQSTGKESFQENIMPASSYEISGNRSGQVTVKDKVTGQIRTFQMQEAVVRELFLLDNDHTVAASQKDHTVFWDLDTGQEIRRFDERIYGFSHDESKFFTYSPQTVTLYSYPNFTPICEFTNLPLAGPERFIFSPDDRFLAVALYTGRPASDESYPEPERVQFGIPYRRLFDLKTCQEIQEFSKHSSFVTGKFSEDSKFYENERTIISKGDFDLKIIWRFDLETHQFQDIITEQARDKKKQAIPYKISGDRSGLVTVEDKASGRVISTFQMQEGVVRELFLLDGGQTVGASQKDHAVFWDLNTGREIRRFDERVYGFSHDETRFFTYTPQTVTLYSYPNFTPVCQFTKLFRGPEKFLFSPDDRFLAIEFASRRPASDEYYPRTGPRRRSIRYTRLFNIKACQEIPEFSEPGFRQLGKFSEDSKFYDFNGDVVLEGRFVEGAWRFDLTTNKMQKVVE